MVDIKFEVVSTHPKAVDATHDLLERAEAEGRTVIGIEVVSSELLARVSRNIDPQNCEIGRMKSVAAAMIYEMPGICESAQSSGESGKFLLITERVDMDSVAAMALFEEFLDNPPSLEKGLAMSGPQAANLLLFMDNMNKGVLRGNAKAWQPRDISDAILPNPDAGVISAAVADPKLPMAEKVALMKAWIYEGKQPEAYVASHANTMRTINSVLESDGTKVNVNAQGIAVVESILNPVVAMAIGYSQSPVVIACNPEFPVRDADPVRKFTIAQYPNTNILDIPEIRKELDALEQGWVATPDRVSSPTAGTSLTMDQVEGVVAKHIQKPVSEFHPRQLVASLLGLTGGFKP